MTQNLSEVDVQKHYEEYPYPSYPWYARARWKDLKSVDFAQWKVKRGVRDAWIAGCGTIAPLMFGRRNPRVKILATDFSSRSLRQVRWRLFLYGIHNVQLRQENLLEAERHEAFDAIDCFGVLHHLPEPQKALGILANALRSQGVLRLMLYSRAARETYEKHRQVLRGRPRLSSSELMDYIRENALELKGDLSTESGRADALLHPLVWTYGRQEVENLVASVPSLQIRELREDGNFILFCEKNKSESQG